MDLNTFFTCSPIYQYKNLNSSINSLNICSLIFNSIFISLFNGPVVIYNLLNGNILIQNSVFSNCSSTGYKGGALSIIAENFLGKFLCASNCKTNLHGHFSITSVTSIHSIQDCSISHCSPKSYSVAHFLMFSYYGYQSIIQTNLSFNSAYSYCLPEFHEYLSLLISFCNINDNYAQLFGGLYTQSSIYPSNMNFSNIIRNNSPTGYGVIMTYYTTFSISNCIILNNFDTLFYVHNSGTIIISNNYIIHNFNFGDISSNGNFLLLTNTFLLIHNFCYKSFEFTYKKSLKFNIIILEYFFIM